MLGNSIFIAFLLGTIGYPCFIIFKKFMAAKNKLEYMDRTFWSFGNTFQITAVHKMMPSADDPSGYTSVKYTSPEEWKNLIRVESAFLNLRQTVAPVDRNDFLLVFVRKNGMEKYIHLQ